MRIFNPPARLHLATFLLLIAVYLVVPVPVLAAVGVSQGEVMEGEAPMPEEIWNLERFSYAVFVASDRLLPPTSRVIDRELLIDAHAADIEYWLTAPRTGGCVPVDNYSHDYNDEEPRGRNGLSSALLQSDRVITGRVNGWQTGVSADRPGTLFRIRVEEALKGEFPDQEMFVFFPTGDVELGGQSLCVRNRAWPDRPDLGDLMLVIISNDALARDNPIFLPKSSSIVTFDGDRVRRLASLYRNVEPTLRELSTDELLDLIRFELKEARP